jgi:hypothetical protein
MEFPCRGPEGWVAQDPIGRSEWVRKDPAKHKLSGGGPAPSRRRFATTLDVGADGLLADDGDVEP